MYCIYTCIYSIVYIQLIELAEEFGKIKDKKISCRTGDCSSVKVQGFGFSSLYQEGTSSVLCVYVCTTRWDQKQCLSLSLVDHMQRKEDQEFEVSLSYIGRLSKKTTETATTKPY